MKVETNNIIGNVGLTSEVIYATQLMCNCFIGALSCFFQPTITRVLQNNSYVYLHFIFLKKYKKKFTLPKKGGNPLEKDFPRKSFP